MVVRKLLVGAGMGAVLALGTAAAPAQAAPVSVSDVVILSCPPGAPTARPGYRCLSSYATEAQCDEGVKRNIAATPATSGYCTGYPGRWWGFVNVY
ncbi:hypothetical protein [Saccharothrix syringae]|uniref:Uncharacterized protein n=1 Tax=Saccharothrix syringae TaxID=103733 RepID=A0A5Q0GXH0_SACSY|nr:hypothetical protein [Saccharothrix syringae]QFZ18365.1 hypothetical protein EKG83_13515 [Saccharothrix syringae]